MIPDEVKPFFPEWLIISFAILGFLIAIIKIIQFLLRLIPSLKRDTYDILADWTKNRSLIKQARAARIEETLNNIIIQFQQELPIDWVHQVSLKWVSKLNPSDIQEGEVILKVEVDESQDKNLLSSVFYFFNSSLFPGLKEVIPSSVRDSISLQFSRRVVEEQHSYLNEFFTDEFLESQIQRNGELVEFLDNFKILDKRGFLSAIFIRELHEIGIRARHKPLRNTMKEEAASLTKHIRSFIEDAKGTKVWHRKGPETSYAILLVAEEGKSYAEGKKPYIAQAFSWQKQNIDRLYVLGASTQRKFTNQVIESIASIPGYKLIEVFETNRDYRSDKYGTGAIFINKK